MHRSKAYRVNRCLICADPAIDATTDGRFVTTACPNCLAVLAIEFDPPDQPELRARIERLDEFDDGGTPPAWARELAHVVGEASPLGSRIDGPAIHPTLETVPSGLSSTSDVEAEVVDDVRHLCPLRGMRRAARRQQGSAPVPAHCGLT